MKNAFIQWIIATLIFVIQTIIRLTCRIQIQNKEVIVKAYKEQRPVIVTLWHGRLLLMPLLFPYFMRSNALISAHRDGRIIQKTALLNNIQTVTGSSSKGGATALREMMRKIKDGQSMFITPDGPKGPACKAQSGAVELSRMTKAPIIPTAISTSRGWILGSWDKFLIPRPFSTIYVKLGEPLTVESKEERDEKTQELEGQLNALQTELDKNAQFKGKVS